MVDQNRENFHDRAIGAQRLNRRIAGFDAVGSRRDLLLAHEQAASNKP
jgi:hypothetical protein